MPPSGGSWSFASSARIVLVGLVGSWDSSPTQHQKDLIRQLAVKLVTTRLHSYWCQWGPRGRSLESPRLNKVRQARAGEHSTSCLSWCQLGPVGSWIRTPRFNGVEWFCGGETLWSSVSPSQPPLGSIGPVKSWASVPTLKLTKAMWVIIYQEGKLTYPIEKQWFCVNLFPTFFREGVRVAEGETELPSKE